MKQQPQRRLELAIRRNKGKALSAGELLKVSRLLGYEVDESAFISLDETDALFERFREGFARSNRQEMDHYTAKVAATYAELIAAILASLQHGIASGTVAVYRANSEYTGALRLPAGKVLAVALRLVALDAEELKMISLDGQCGLLLEQHTERRAGAAEEVLQLWVWGSPWTRFLNST